MRIDRDAVENEINELELRLHKLRQQVKQLDRADELSRQHGQIVTVEILPQWAIAGPQFVFGAK